MLGKLFSTAPADENDVWPFNPMRDALENIINQELSDGLKTSLYNTRGIHSRGIDEGGDDERKLAEKFRRSANILEYSHPQISKVLKRLVDTYQREAVLRDEEIVIRRRL